MTLANLLPRELRFFLQPFRESAPLLGATQEFSWPRHFRKTMHLIENGRAPPIAKLY